MADGGSGGSGPPDKWTFSAKVDTMNSGDVLDLLNDEFASGNNTVLYAECSDGKFLFFGYYKK